MIFCSFLHFYLKDCGGLYICQAHFEDVGHLLIIKRRIRCTGRLKPISTHKTFLQDSERSRASRTFIFILDHLRRSWKKSRSPCTEQYYCYRQVDGLVMTGARKNICLNEARYEISIFFPKAKTIEKWAEYLRIFFRTAPLFSNLFCVHQFMRNNINKFIATQGHVMV